MVPRPDRDLRNTGSNSRPCVGGTTIPSDRRRIDLPQVATIYSHMAMHTRRRARRHSAPDQLSAVFGALADPTRRAMLERLRTQPLTVTELNEPFRMSQPTISKHLKVLERAGLVVRGREAQFRPRALRAAPLKDANQYLERFRMQWDDRLHRLEAYVARLQQKS